MQNKPIKSMDLLPSGIPKPSESFQAVMLAEKLSADTPKACLLKAQGCYHPQPLREAPQSLLRYPKVC